MAVRRDGVRDTRAEFVEFYETNKDSCLRAVAVSIADRDLAEELVGEAFARAWIGWAKVRDHASPAAWVVRVALNTRVSWWRRRRREVPLAHHDAAHDDLELGLDRDVTAALRCLSQRQREVVALRLLLDLDTETTARALGIAPGTVTAHLARAMRVLRHQIPSPDNDRTVSIGTQAHDTAQITGATANAGGTITYKLYANSDCTGLIQDLTPVNNTVVNGVAPDSLPFTFNNAGTFYFYAEYSGDAHNIGPVNSGCAAEPYVVNPNTPAPHSTPVVQIKDTFTVTGLTSGATGNVVVGLYSDSQCSAGSQLGSDALFAANTNVNGTLTGQTSFVTEPQGSYFYKISYVGDNNNTGFSSCAESVGITITALP